MIFKKYSMHEVPAVVKDLLSDSEHLERRRVEC